MLVWDRLSVYQASSNWTAVRLQWRRGTAGAFDWELFYSQPPAVAPTVTNNHWCTSHPRSLVVFIQYFQLMALQKSRWSLVDIRSGPALIKAKHTHTSGAFIKPLISLLTFSFRRPTLPTLMPRVVPAWNWPCLTPEAGSGPWWQGEVPQWCTGKAIIKLPKTKARIHLFLFYFPTMLLYIIGFSGKRAHMWRSTVMVQQLTLCLLNLILRCCHFSERLEEWASVRVQQRDMQTHQPWLIIPSVHC